MSIISFAVGAAGQTIGALGQIAQALGATEEVLQGFNVAALAADLVIRGLTTAFGLFVGQNQELNSQLLKTQALLLTNTQLFDELGNPITNLTEGIRASKGQLNEVLKQLQKDTESLVGLTSADVNEIFGYVNQNIGSLVGQTQKGGDVLDSARRLTKVIAAAGGVTGIQGGQFNQETRAIITGDGITSPDTKIAQSLGINKTELEKARREGRLVDYIEEKGAGAIAANAEGSRSIEGISSNIKDVFERLTREAGEPLMDPIIDGLQQVFDYLKKNEDQIKNGISKAVNKLWSLIKDVVTAVQDLVTAWKPVLSLAFENVKSIFSLALEGFGNIVRAIGSIGSAIGSALSGVLPIAEQLGIIGIKAQELKEGEKRDSSNSGRGNLIEQTRDAIRANAQSIPVIAQVQTAANALTGRKLTSNDANDARDALNEELSNGDRRADSLTTARLDDLKATPQQKQRLKRLSVSSDIEGLEGTANNLENLQLYNQVDRARRDDAVAKYKKQIDEIKAYADANQIDLVGEITIDAKELRKQADAGKAVLEDYNGLIERLGASRGVQIDFDKLAEGFAKQNSLLKEQGVISLDLATEQLEKFISDENIKAELRLAAQQQVLKYYDEQANRAKKLADIDVAASKALVANGRLTAEDGAAVAARGEVTKGKIDGDNLRKKIDSSKSLRLDTKDLENELKLNEQAQSEAQGKLVDANSKSFQAKVSVVIDKAKQSLAQLSAERSLINTKLDAEGKTTQEDRAVNETKEEFADNANQRAVAETELKNLENAPVPASMAERLALEKKITQAKLEVTKLTEKGIQLETQYRDQVAARAEAEIAYAARLRDRSIGDDETAAATQLVRNSLNTFSDEEAVDKNISDKQINENRLASNRQQKRDLLEAPRAASKAAQRQTDEKLAQLDSDYLGLVRKESELAVEGVRAVDKNKEIEIKAGIQNRQNLFDLEVAETENRIQSGSGSEADKDKERTQVAVVQSRKRVELARQEFLDIQSLKPADVDEQRQQELDLATLKQKLLQASNAQIQAEIKLKQQTIQETLKLKQIELERQGIQSNALNLQIEAGQQILANLQEQVDIEKELQNLAVARTGLELQLQQNKVSSLAEAKNLLAVEEKANKEGNGAVAQEAQRQRRELGFFDNESQTTVAKRTLDESTKLLEIQINAEQQKLNFARQAFEFEQQKTKLALEQEQTAARRRLIEGQINTEKLKLQKEQILADQSLTEPQKAAQVKSIDSQIELSQISEKLDRSALKSTNRQVSNLSALQQTQAQTFNLNEAATIAQKNFDFSKQNRANRLQFAEDGGQLYNLNNKVGGIESARSSGPMVVQDPELLGAIRELNEILSKDSSGVTVVNNFPELSASRAMQRMAGY